jgi:trans-AT polyketide synthase/acyltransferase/oxidoreductase domain-containing protein
VSSPEELLKRYRARQVRLVSEGGEASAEGPGGGLVDAVETQGLGPLSGALCADPGLREIQLVDAGVVLRAARVGEGATLTVAWSSGEHWTEPLAIEPWGAVSGPLFVAGPGAEVTLEQGLAALDAPLFVRADGACFSAGRFGDDPGARPLAAWLPPAAPLGSAAFREAFGVRANYIAGAMAGGISSARLVIAMAEAGLLGFFGAGGLPLAAVADALDEVKAAVGERPFGFNLLHNPAEPAVEEATVDLYLERGCRLVSASAFMGLTPALVRFRYTGAAATPDGGVRCPNRVFAKVSRPEVARHFLAPPPEATLRALVEGGWLSREEARLAARAPVADAITCEADSAGHTDRRPLPVILPIIRGLRDAAVVEHGWRRPIFVGAAGGLGCPAAVAAAFAMGADYVLTGSINQASIEAGTSPAVKALLAEAGMADVAMGPAPDMFELGASVQVLASGSLYAQRARRLYELYRAHGAWSEVPERDRSRVERQILRRTFDEVWADCEAYWGERDPEKLEKARGDGRLQMALVFRWYLGMTSRWARAGEAGRKRDFQIWCGPSMGAFNDWARGGPLEPLEARGVVAIADALMREARVLRRRHALAEQGAPGAGG